MAFVYKRMSNVGFLAYKLSNVLHELSIMLWTVLQNNLKDLQSLIDKWREVSQKALGDLLEAHPEPRPSMTQLIDHLLIDHDLIQYSTDDEVFS